MWLKVDLLNLCWLGRARGAWHPTPGSTDIMASAHPTFADLRKAGTISSTEIVAAVDLYMRDPNIGPYRFASGHSIDIAAAVAASPGFHALKAKPGPQEKTFRNAVTAAVMSAVAETP